MFAVNRRPLGIDPERGTGTAYEGYVRVPKPGGIKKGWHRQFAVVCDFKLFLFDAIGDRQTQISPSASLVLDMRYKRCHNKRFFRTKVLLTATYFFRLQR